MMQYWLTFHNWIENRLCFSPKFGCVIFGWNSTAEVLLQSVSSTVAQARQSLLAETIWNLMQRGLKIQKKWLINCSYWHWLWGTPSLTPRLQSGCSSCFCFAANTFSQRSKGKCWKWQCQDLDLWWCHEVSTESTYWQKLWQTKSLPSASIGASDHPRPLLHQQSWLCKSNIP